MLNRKITRDKFIRLAAMSGISVLLGNLSCNLPKKSSGSEDELKFYTSQSGITDPEKYAYLLKNLPDDIPSLCRIIQDLVFHFTMAEAYHIKLSDDRLKELSLRCFSRQIKRVLELNDSLLTIRRIPEQRLVGCCRDFALFLTAILRYKGIPARVRAGFAAYFAGYRYGAHYICQYWNASEKRWVTVDAQIDFMQRMYNKIDFDTCDLPENKFISGGRAWQMCRSRKTDPKEFSIHEWNGMGLVRYKLIMDLLALNKIELTPLDSWKYAVAGGQEAYSSENEARFFDRLAAVTQGDEPDFDQILSIYKNTAELHPQSGWKP